MSKQDAPETSALSGDNSMATERIPTPHEAELPSERTALPPPEPGTEDAAFLAGLSKVYSEDPNPEDEYLIAGRRAAVQQPSIIRGADNQAAAYEALLAQWRDVDPEEDERTWQRVKHNLQQTRRELGERLLFTE